LVTQVPSLKKSGLGVQPGFEMEEGLETQTAMSGMIVPHEEFDDEAGWWSNRKP